MANRPKDKGTRAETAVVNWLHEQGFRQARRNALAGTNDLGDIDVIPMDPPPIIISVKNGYGGKACPSCNHIRPVQVGSKLFREWWLNLGQVAQRRNVNALTLLTLKRAGKTSPAYWHWFAHSQQLDADPKLGIVEITGEQAAHVMRSYRIETE